MKRLAVLAAALCVPLAAFARQNKVLAAEQRFVDLSNRIELEHDRAKKAFLAEKMPYALFEAQTDLESLSREVNSAEIVVALSKDEPSALETAQAEYLELSGRLASYRALVGSCLNDPAAVSDGLKTLFRADSEASVMRADLLDLYQGPERLAVVVFPDGAGKLALRVFTPKSMPAQAIAQGIQKSAAKRALAVKVFDLPDFEP